MQINSIGYTNSVYRQNTTPNYKSKPAAKNVSFGMFSICNTQAILAEQYAAICKAAEKANLNYKKIIPVRRVPEDGVWGVVGSKLNNFIKSGNPSPEELTGYKIRHVYVKVPDEPSEGTNIFPPGSYTRKHRVKVMRRTFTQDNGQIKYYQDLYPNGKVETRIVKRTPHGEILLDYSWVEMIG